MWISEEDQEVNWLNRLWPKRTKDFRICSGKNGNIQFGSTEMNCLFSMTKYEVWTAFGKIMLSRLFLTCYSYLIYSRTSVTQTPTARLHYLTGPRAWIPMIPYIRLLWSNSCIYVFMLLFSFSAFPAVIENRKWKKNYTKTLTIEAPYIGLESLEFT